MDDLISRSAVTDAIVDLLVFEWGYEGIEESVNRIFNEIPAVDAVEVARCRDCVHYQFGFCMRSIMYSKKPNRFCESGERRGE